MMVGIDDFTFMAIPLFVFAGELMNVDGITFRLVRLAQGVVGHIRGGLAYVTGKVVVENGQLTYKTI